MSIELREYQQDLYDKTLNAFRNGQKRVLVTVGCGAGKSYIFAKMAERTKGPVLVLTHRKNVGRLLDGTESKIDMWGYFSREIAAKLGLSDEKVDKNEN